MKNPEKRGKFTHMDFSKLKKIYCVGSGGIGVSALAKLFLSRGVKVLGFDQVKSEITDELLEMGALLFFGEPTAELPADVELLIYSPAVPTDHPLRQAAINQKIPELSYPAALAKLAESYETIAVSGTHGKSTTTAMIGLILEEAKLDPLVIVGSKVKTFPYGNLRPGKSDKFVVEACEHQAHMQLIKPHVAVVTNIEKDHLDYYQNLNNIKKAFEKFIGQVPRDGLVVLNASDQAAREIANAAEAGVVTFGLTDNAHLKAERLKVQHQRQIFNLKYQGKNLGVFSLKIPGEYNVMNALAAALTALEMGVSPAVIKDALGKFEGLWRRFEKIGTYREALVVADYAHHPTAITATLKAAKEFYPGKRIMLVFQPHQYQRLAALYDDFLTSFAMADELILAEVYGVLGREDETPAKTSRDLATALELAGQKVTYAPDLDQALRLVQEQVRPQDLLIIMGAGDIYSLGGRLLEDAI